MKGGSALPAPTGEEVPDSVVKEFQELIHRYSGIWLSESKRPLILTKLTKRMRALQIDDYEKYLALLSHPENAGEITQLLDAVSVNVTSFFREDAHFQFLRARALPEAKARGEYLHIWSAACATGEEPYSIAMTVAEALPEHRRFPTVILATDISTAALEKAAAGVYPGEKAASIPAALREKYFERLDPGGRQWRAGDEMRSLIRFRHFNLNDPNWPFRKRFDVIFCRNAMIYFTRETQQDLITRFARFLKPGGYLFVGHSESLVGIRHGLAFVAATIYRSGGA